MAEDFKLDPSTRADLRNYTTSQLSEIYHTQDRGLIRLRNGIVTHEVLRNEIRKRKFWAGCSFWATLIVTLVGATAAIIAAIEGWPK